MNEVFVISGNTPDDVRQELRSEEVLLLPSKTNFKCVFGLCTSELFAKHVSFLAD